MAVLNAAAEAEFWAGVEAGSKFFMGTSNLRLAMEKLAQLLESAGIEYAVIGAMALNEFGYRRMTSDVDILLTDDGLAAFKALHLGRGYLEKFPGSRGLRDTEHNIEIDVVLSGGFPGDGKPKPVAFPHPSIAQKGQSVRLLPLPRLVELKLASGMTAIHRLKDLADVLELIRAAKLSRDLGAQLDEFVREKYFELWDAAASAQDD